MEKGMTELSAAPPAAAGEAYGFPGLDFLPAGRARSLAVPPGTEGARLVDARDATLLQQCRTFKPLQDHAREICRRLGWDAGHEPAVRERLERLAGGGLLLSRGELSRRCAELPRSQPPPPLEQIAVLTRDRPESLAACVESILANLRDHGRAPRILVADDTPDPARRTETREMLARLGTRFGLGIAVAGPEERQRFVREIVRRGGFRPEAAEFGFADVQGSGFAPGLNRNLLFAETAGSLFACVDDDTVCTPAPVPESRPGPLVYGSTSDPSAFWFHSSRDEACRAVRPERRDYLSLHEQLLGRPVLSGFVPLSPEIDGDLSSILRWLTAGEGRVRVTQTGLYGDSGLGSPVGLFALTGRSRERLVRSEQDYRTALSSREIVRGVAAPTLDPGRSFMAYSVAFDNREFLPPFMPAFRGEDDVFATLFRRCLDRDRIGHVPWTILHAPRRSRALSPDQFWPSVLATPLRSLVVSCIASASVFPSWDPRKKLAVIGRHLEELGAIPARDFREFLRRMQWDDLMRWRRTLEAMLQTSQGAPVYWARDVEQALERSAELLGTDRLITPCELGLDAAQEFIRRFGTFLTIWPQLWEAARDARAAGVSAAVPVRS